MDGAAWSAALVIRMTSSLLYHTLLSCNSLKHSTELMLYEKILKKNTEQLLLMLPMCTCKHDIACLWNLSTLLASEPK